MNWYLINFDPFTTWSDTQLVDIDFSDKIFILGSSQVASLNTSHIENFLKETDKKYQVYNLAQGADFPSLRLGDIDKMISLNPALIIYGVGFRDFETKQSLNFSPLDSNQIITEHVLPAPRLFDENTELMLKENNFINKILKSPQIISLKLFNYVIRGEFEYYYPNIELKTPLIPFANYSATVPNSEIQEKFEKESIPFRGIQQNNLELIALSKILQKLQNNDIDIIVFSVPYNKAYLDNLSDNDIAIFTNSLEQITSENQVPLYYFHDKYAELEIWGDVFHTSYNKDTIIYSDDIAEIIIKEINP